MTNDTALADYQEKEEQEVKEEVNKTKQSRTKQEEDFFREDQDKGQEVTKEEEGKGRLCQSGVREEKGNRRIIYDRSKQSKGTRRRIKQGCSTKDCDKRITTTTGNKGIASLVIAITMALRQELGMIFTWVLVYTQCKGLKDIIVN